MSTLWHEIITKIIPREWFFVIFEGYCALEMSRKEIRFQGIAREIRNFPKIIIQNNFSEVIILRQRVIVLCRGIETVSVILTLMNSDTLHECKYFLGTCSTHKQGSKDKGRRTAGPGIATKHSKTPPRSKCMDPTKYSPCAPPEARRWSSFDSLGGKLREIWREFCRIFSDLKIKAQKVRGKFRRIFRGKICASIKNKFRANFVLQTCHSNKLCPKNTRKHPCQRNTRHVRFGVFFWHSASKDMREGMGELYMGKMGSICHIPRAVPASIWGHCSQILVFASMWGTQKGVWQWHISCCVSQHLGILRPQNNVKQGKTQNDKSTLFYTPTCICSSDSIRAAVCRDIFWRLHGPFLPSLLSGGMEREKLKSTARRWFCLSFVLYSRKLQHMEALKFRKKKTEKKNRKAQSFVETRLSHGCALSLSSSPSLLRNREVHSPSPKPPFWAHRNVICLILEKKATREPLTFLFRGNLGFEKKGSQTGKVWTRTLEFMLRSAGAGVE